MVEMTITLFGSWSTEWEERGRPGSQTSLEVALGDLAIVVVGEISVRLGHSLGLLDFDSFGQYLSFTGPDYL